MANFALGLQAGTDSGSRMVRAYNDAQENTRREAEHGYKMKDAARNEQIAQNQFDAALEYQEATNNPDQYMQKLYKIDFGDLGKGEHAGKQLRIEKDKDGTTWAWATDAEGKQVSEPKQYKPEQIAQAAQKQFIQRVGAFNPKMLQDESQFSRGLEQRGNIAAQSDETARMGLGQRGDIAAQSDETIRRGQDMSAATASNAYSYMYGGKGGGLGAAKIDPELEKNWKYTNAQMAGAEKHLHGLMNPKEGQVVRPQDIAAAQSKVRDLRIREFDILKRAGELPKDASLLEHLGMSRPDEGLQDFAQLLIQGRMPDRDLGDGRIQRGKPITPQMVDAMIARTQAEYGKVAPEEAAKTVSKLKRMKEIHFGPQGGRGQPVQPTDDEAYSPANGYTAP